MRRLADLTILSLLVLSTVRCSGTMSGSSNEAQGGATTATGGTSSTQTGSAGTTVGSGGTGQTNIPVGGGGGDGSTVSMGGTGGTGGSASTIDPPPAGAGDLPCEVQNLLATRCQGCHMMTPPGLMLSFADMTKTATSDPTKTVAEVALARMQATGIQHMPPNPLPAATPDEIAAYSAWLQAGPSAGSCGAPTDPVMNPYDTPTVCTSAMNWTGGNRESPLMRPGGECISCHTSSGEGPSFSLAGTLFPTAHEPNDCNGVDDATGAQIVITDANGMEYTLMPNAAGNFFREGSLALPYFAKVIYDGRERAMLESQESGDCNSCHTEAGTTTTTDPNAASAPGRIFLP